MRNKAARYTLYKQLKSPDISKILQKLIVLDFIIELSFLKELLIEVSYNAILVITYRLIKYTYILLQLITIIIEDLAYILNRVIIANHRILDKLISDKDKLFKSKIQTILIAFLNINRKISIVFYLEIDRQIKRINQIIGAYLKYYINY